MPAFDPSCALCPGNARIGGTNSASTGAYWFTNDLPCFGPDAPPLGDHDGLYRRRGPGRGGPLGRALRRARSAGGLIYGHTEQEVESGQRHFARTGEFLGQAVLARELAGPRGVAANHAFVACVPWFARFAAEWPADRLVELVMEGAEGGDAHTFPRGGRPAPGSVTWSWRR